MTDEETLRRIIREELERVGLEPARQYRISPDAVAQRRAAGKASAEARAQRKSTKSATKSATKRARKTGTYNDSVDSVGTKANEIHASPGSKVFLAYATAYKLRYGAFPVRNAKVNSLLVQLVRRLGEADAGAVAGFYCGLEEPLYDRAAHPVDLLVRDAEKLHMKWETSGGRPGNGSRQWWEHWRGIEEQGDELGIDRDPDNPQGYKSLVLRAARRAGRLPDHAAEKLGVP